MTCHCAECIHLGRKFHPSSEQCVYCGARPGRPPVDDVTMSRLRDLVARQRLALDALIARVERQGGWADIDDRYALVVAKEAASEPVP